MKKIIHMSDLHTGSDDLSERLRWVVKGIILEKGEKASDYVIVVTGDLVDDATKHPITCYDEVESVLDTLKQAGFTVLVCPGNHDYGTGAIGDKEFVPQFKQSFYGDDKPYPRVDVIGDMAFLGLDSTAEELHWYDRVFSQGELGEAQLDRLSKKLRTKVVRSCAKRIVYLHHHPFDAYPTLRLKDSADLLSTLEGAIKDGVLIDALLYGHNHQGRCHNGARLGIRNCYDAGTATGKESSRILEMIPWLRTRAATRVIDLEKNTHYILDLL